MTIPDPGASTDTFALIGKTQTFTGACSFTNYDLTSQGIVCKAVSGFSVPSNTSAIHTYVNGNNDTYYDKGTNDSGGHTFRNNNGSNNLASFQTNGATLPNGVIGLTTAPSTGKVGEVIRVYNPSYNYYGSGNPAAALTITLPSAGVWDVVSNGSIYLHFGNSKRTIYVHFNNKCKFYKCIGGR